MRTPSTGTPSRLCLACRTCEVQWLGCATLLLCEFKAGLLISRIYNESEVQAVPSSLTCDEIRHAKLDARSCPNYVPRCVGGDRLVDGGEVPYLPNLRWNVKFTAPVRRGGRLRRLGAERLRVTGDAGNRRCGPQSMRFQFRRDRRRARQGHAERKTMLLIATSFPRSSRKQ